MNLEDLVASVQAKKARLDELRPLSQRALAALQKSYDVDLTYTSNAIEGNTLTLRETSEVIEHGITVGGKSLRDHLEAVDHYEAVLWMRELAVRNTVPGEATVRELHRRIVARSQPDIAGIYSPHARRIAGSVAIFPNPLKVPQLMEEFGVWLRTAEASPAASFEAHFRLSAIHPFRLSAIHPFSDGNGRTARLLMNLLLLRAGYVPVTVRPEDRKTYLDALEYASLHGDVIPFQTLLHTRLDETLDDYLTVLA